jgi:acetyl esterase/lipase
VAEQGFVVATIEYRTTADKATYADGIADVKSAVRYLRAHAQDYGIDPAKIAVWGQSAGGYLAAMTGVSNGDKAFDKGDDLDRSSSVQAVIDQFGSSDMSKLADDFDAKTRQTYDDPNNPIERYVGGPDSQVSLLADPLTSTKANPISYINGSTPPFLIFSGSNDRIISPSQTLLLHRALTAAGVRSTRIVLTGAGHGDMAFLGDPQSGLPWSTNRVMGEMVRFLRTEIGPPGG